MCAPTCRGGAYLAASVFIYRSLLLIVSSISCGITGYKMTYLNVPYLEEFMLHLIYFIPLFTASGFALMGIEECSFNFVLFSSLALSTTLFVRYGAELTYIYAYDWSAFRLKTPNLFLNILLDSIFILTLLIYAYQELRDPQKKQNAKLVNNRRYSAFSASGNRQTKGQTEIAGTTSPGPPPGPLLSSKAKTYSNILNEFERKNLKNSNLEAAAAISTANKKTSSSSKATSTGSKEAGIGHGERPGKAFYYPITPVDQGFLKRPLPFFPTPDTIEEFTELDDISLPPPIPLASPEHDDV